MVLNLKRLFACCITACLLGGGVLAAWGSQHGSLTLYRLNNHNQLIESAEINGDIGCNNFLWRRSAYRVAQRGYAYCELYTERNCKAESLAPAEWLGSHYRPQNIDTSKPQQRILPGTRWQLSTEEDRMENRKIASWRCAYEDE